MVGIVCAEDHEGFDSCAYPDSQWLVFATEGKISGNVSGNAWKRMYDKFLPRSNRQAVYPTIKSYKVWDMESGECEVEIMIPVEAKNGRSGRLQIDFRIHRAIREVDRGRAQNGSGSR